jgi:uncharacterized C2H2 Zn-finger protein
VSGAAVCTRKNCVALEARAGLCAAHANGYDQHDGSRHLRCATCQKLIRSGDWYRRVGETVRHVRSCKAPAASSARGRRAGVSP